AKRSQGVAAQRLNRSSVPGDQLQERRAPMLYSRTSPIGQDADATPAARTVQRVERDEARLVGRIAAGDLRAFEAMYRAYYPRLTRFLGRVIRRPGIVEAVLNDTMLVVWHRREGYN